MNNYTAIKMFPCILFALALLILPGHVLAEPLKPKNYDILGIKLGMSMEEVAVVAESLGFAQNMESTISIPDNDNTYVAFHRWAKPGEPGVFYTYYARPPSDPLVIYVLRIAHEQFYPLPQLQTSLFQKYGQPTDTRNSSRERIMHGWYHGEGSEHCALIPGPFSPPAQMIKSNYATSYGCDGIHLVASLLRRRDGSYALQASYLVDYTVLIESMNLHKKHLETLADQHKSEPLETKVKELTL